jgi:S1-C subfamily serine protease
LKARDVILEVDGRRSGSMIDFNQALVAAGDERDLDILVRRSGQSLHLTLRLKQERKVFNNELIQQRLGLTLRPVQGGFAVATVERGGPAAKANLEPGNYLTALDGQQPDDLVSAAKLVASKARGEVIELGVLMVERNGFFQRRYQGTVPVKLR